MEAGMALDDAGVVIPCPSCGQKNRLRFERLGESGQCGRCNTALPPPSAPLAVDTEARFDRLIASSTLPVVIDFWAAWCGPCRMVAPEFDKVAAANGGRLVVAKVDTKALPALAERFGVCSLPTMAVFVGGREAARTAGARPAPAIESWVREVVSSQGAARSAAG